MQYQLLPLDGGGHHEEGSEAGGVGEFVVKTGQMMFSGYHGRPELTADAFTPDGFYRCAWLGLELGLGLGLEYQPRVGARLHLLPC